MNTRVQTDVQKRINSGDIGKHLLCLICHPDHEPNQMQTAVCGALFIPKLTKVTFLEAVERGTTCPLCIMSAISHVDKHIEKGEYTPHGQ